jgi:hypothetical protein
MDSSIFVYYFIFVQVFNIGVPIFYINQFIKKINPPFFIKGNWSILSFGNIIFDIQIYDVSKCFDKLEYVTTANDLYNAGVQDERFVLIANSNRNCNVAIKTPWGSTTKQTMLNNIEMQGTVLAPLKC